MGSRNMMEQVCPVFSFLYLGRVDQKAESSETFSESRLAVAGESSRNPPFTDLHVSTCWKSWPQTSSNIYSFKDS